jgi:electron transfer flavoprotein alpha subunit
MSQDIFVVIEHLRGHVSEISYVSLAAARSLAQGSGGNVVGVLLGHNAGALAADLRADRILQMDDAALADFTPDAYLAALAGLLTTHQPRAAVLGNTSIGADLAGALSARLGLPLVSSCLQVSADGKLVCRIYGGKIMAEVSLPEQTTMITVIPGGHAPEDGRSETPPEVATVPFPGVDERRVTLKGYIEPEAGDVDISREAILVAVGRGIQRQDNLELAEELAKVLGGVVCASRPVVDQGWLPTSRLVGKSGKAVKAKVYLALGISGAPEHVEALSAAETIIAVNTDATAPIFEIAKYGAQTDLFDLVPALTEKIRQAKAA